MATFTKRKNGYYAQIRRKGHKSIGRTFNTKLEAERWAFKVESDMGIGTYTDNRETLSTTLDQCLDRYSNEILPSKKGRDREKYRIKQWKNHDLALRPIGTIKQSDVAKWRDWRIEQGISASTISKDLALLSHLFTIAIKEWGFPLDNPVLKIRKPKIKNERDRRLIGNEEERLLENCHSQEMKVFIILAVETAMRRGEIAGIERSWIRGRVIYLPDSKNSEKRNVPLSSRAVQAINLLPGRIDGKLFQYNPDAYTRGFIKACKKSGITNLVLHDLRHEATSRFFEKGLDLMQVMSITGHKDTKMLKRYTHLDANDLADMLG